MAEYWIDRWLPMSDDAKTGDPMLIKVDLGGGPQAYLARWDEELEIFVFVRTNRGYWAPVKEWHPAPQRRLDRGQTGKIDIVNQGRAT